MTSFLSGRQELQRNTVRNAPINLTGSKWKDVQVLLCRFETWQQQTKQKKAGKLCKKSKCCTLDWRGEARSVLKWRSASGARRALQHYDRGMNNTAASHQHPQRLPLEITARLYHFRWQLGQIACHSPSIWQNRWVIPLALAQPSSLLHYSSLFAPNRNVFIWPSPLLYGPQPPHLKNTHCFGICVRLRFSCCRSQLLFLQLAVRLRVSAVYLLVHKDVPQCVSALLTANNAFGREVVGVRGGVPPSQQSYRSSAQSVGGGPPDSVTKNTNKQLNNTLAARRLSYIKI